MKEEWRKITESKGNYYVSSFGRIKNGEKIRSIYSNLKRNNYCYVSLSRKDRGITNSVHRLVAKYFIPNPYNKPCVNHLDFDVTNNHVSNLEWCTYKENIHYTINAGRRNIPYGLKSGNVKLTLKQVRAIRKYLATGIWNDREVGERNDTNAMNVFCIRHGTRWSHTF